MLHHIATLEVAEIQCMIVSPHEASHSHLSFCRSGIVGPVDIGKVAGDFGINTHVLAGLKHVAYFQFLAHVPCSCLYMPIIAQLKGLSTVLFFL
jgi:hypothetical protein